MTLKARRHEQYFTQAGIAKLCVSLLPGARPKNAIDPAAGECSFLDAVRERWQGVELHGVDIDRSVLPESKSGTVLVVADSLRSEAFSDPRLRAVCEIGGYDLVVGNPPFSGKTDKVRDPDLLAEYTLAHLPDGRLRQGAASEVLFLERFTRLAKPGGWIVIVLPRGLLCNPRSEYVREFMVSTCVVAKVLDLPAGVFDGTRASASVLLCQKREIVASGTSPGEMVSLLEADRVGDEYRAHEVARAESQALVRRMDSGYHSTATVRLRGQLLFLPGAKRLGDVAGDIVQGYSKYGKRRRFVQHGGARYLESRVVSPIGILDGPRRYVSPTGGMVRATAFVEPNDLLIVRVGTGCVGRATVALPHDRGSVINDCIYRLQVSASPGYIALYLSTRIGKALLGAASQQSGGATTLSKEFIREIPIPFLGTPIEARLAEEYVDSVLRGPQASRHHRLHRLSARLDEAIRRALQRLGRRAQARPLLTRPRTGPRTP